MTLFRTALSNPLSEVQFGENLIQPNQIVVKNETSFFVVAGYMPSNTTEDEDNDTSRVN